MAIVKAMWGGWLRAIYFLFARVSVLLIFIVGLNWTYIVFVSLKEDTMTMTNAAFAIAANPYNSFVLLRQSGNRLRRS
jgi:hypothetical protein